MSQPTRRDLLDGIAGGFAGVALAGMLARDGLAGPVAPHGGLHHRPRARRVIQLFMNGGASQMDLFDYKPQLTKMKGVQIPDSVVGGKRFSTMTGSQTVRPCLPEITKFKQNGDSGAWVSDFMSHTAEIPDELCFVKSMHTTQVNHAPAICFFLTGSEMPGRPSIGSWLTYGLGSETADLPGFVVMTSRDKEASCGQIFYDFYWGSGFLPSKFQGVKFRGSGDPVLYLSNPDGISRESRRAVLDDLAKMNELTLKDFGDPEISTRISQYEMAYRMQMSVPELTDFSKEPKSVLEMYGPDVQWQGSFAYNCLMARRLAERGVRFIQLYHQDWDHHGGLPGALPKLCQETDQPAAALIKDLKTRGLLDDTLVVWAGEFGRTPFSQGSDGRDHNPLGYSIWMAGGGVKGGVSFGETDDFSYNIVKDPVHVNDLNATILHCLGIDHERFTFKFQGLDQRLTGVEKTNVVKEILL